ncbi:MAG: metal ABC transporter substrate-binding protein [Luteolibacter sp.]|uniref:metal ABC transporter substrate-binding protein n=1 Tax=Luteolibacter sp. TaxID=1962973 RepID=UPI0032663A46
MKNIILFLTSIGLLHAAPLNVVVTLPDLADITRQVGGDQVDVYCIASGKEDPHNVPLKPSAITKLAKADLFVQLGLDLEHAYAPALVKESRNQKIQQDGPGFLDLSGGVKPLDVPTSVDRKGGDVHPNGNPHYNTDPVYGQMMARGIAAKLGQLRPESAAMFKANGDKYVAMLQGKLAGWKATLAGKNIKFVCYHPDLSYFAARFGLTQVGTIQPKPGIEPGPRDIQSLAAAMKQSGVKLIVKESFYSDRIPNELAQMTGAKVVNIPIMVNATPEAKDYVSLIDTLVNAFTK